MRRAVDRLVLPLWRRLPPALAVRIRRAYRGVWVALDHAMAVEPAALEAGLRRLGLGTGDLVYVRSAYDDMRSIRATPLQVVETLARVVGASGTLVMPTYPVTGLSQVYLDRTPYFHWRRTPSRSGMVTEVFRRLPGTERSLHPTHPLAARGPLARWLTEGHERCETAFEEGSPFARLYERDAWVLSLGRFPAMTLRHFADHMIRARIPYPLYSDRTTPVRVVGPDGVERILVVRAQNPALGCEHRALAQAMLRAGIARATRVGRVPVTLVRLRPYVAFYARCHERGLVRHFLRPAAGGAPPPGAVLAAAPAAGERP